MNPDPAYPHIAAYSVTRPTFVFEAGEILVCDSTLTALEDGRYYIVRAGGAHAVVQCQHGLLTDSQGVTTKSSEAIARIVRVQAVGRYL